MFSSLKRFASTKDQEPATAAPRRTVVPLCDISESNDKVLLVADMPGVSASNVDVSLHGDLLTLKGTLATEEPASSTAVWREYAQADFERVFRVGHNLDPEHVQASIKDGVLQVELRKREAAQAKKITVQAG